mgnify:FL=1
MAKLTIRAQWCGLIEVVQPRSRARGAVMVPRPKVGLFYTNVMNHDTAAFVVSRNRFATLTRRIVSGTEWGDHTCKGKRRKNLGPFKDCNMHNLL